MQQLKRDREAMVATFEQNNRSVLVHKQQLLAQIMVKRMNKAILSAQLAQAAASGRACEDDLELSKRRIARKRQVLSAYAEKRDRCRDMIKRIEIASFNKTNNEANGLNAIRLRLVELEKTRIDELNKFVFELTELVTRTDDDMEKSTRIALKDARQTVYVNGRWILANDQVVYRVVRSVLPSDGDYMSHLIGALQKDEKRGGAGGSGAGASGTGGGVSGGGSASGGGGGGNGGGGSRRAGSVDDDDAHQLDDIERQSQLLQAANKSKRELIWATTTINTNVSTHLAASAVFGGVAGGGGGGGVKGTVANMTPVNRLVDRYMILSGLTYTIQFVNLIAFYLNILLPYNLPHRFVAMNVAMRCRSCCCEKLNLKLITCLFYSYARLRLSASFIRSH